MWRNVNVFSRQLTRQKAQSKVSSEQSLETRETKADVPVLFNYRYNPCHWKIEEVISSGKIGNVKSVHFEWLLVSFLQCWKAMKLTCRTLYMEQITSEGGIDTRTNRVV